jgi:hypothetical protein
MSPDLEPLTVALIPEVEVPVTAVPENQAAEVPLLPGAPFKFLKAKSKVLALAVPPAVTVTLGVPTLASTLAVALVMVAFVPLVPFVPFVPFFISSFLPSEKVTVLVPPALLF